MRMEAAPTVIAKNYLGQLALARWRDHPSIEAVRKLGTRWRACYPHDSDLCQTIDASMRWLDGRVGDGGRMFADLCELAIRYDLDPDMLRVLRWTSRREQMTTASICVWLSETSAYAARNDHTFIMPSATNDSARLATLVPVETLTAAKTAWREFGEPPTIAEPSIEAGLNLPESIKRFVTQVCLWPALTADWNRLKSSKAMEYTLAYGRAWVAAYPDDVGLANQMDNLVDWVARDNGAIDTWFSLTYFLSELVLTYGLGDELENFVHMSGIFRHCPRPQDQVRQHVWFTKIAQAVVLRDPCSGYVGLIAGYETEHPAAFTSGELATAEAEWQHDSVRSVAAEIAGYWLNQHSSQYATVMNQDSAPSFAAPSDQSMYQPLVPDNDQPRYWGGFDGQPSPPPHMTIEQLCDQFLAELDQAAVDPMLYARMCDDSDLQQVRIWRRYGGWFNARTYWEEWRWRAGLGMALGAYAHWVDYRYNDQFVAIYQWVTERWDGSGQPTGEMVKATYRWEHGLRPGDRVPSGGFGRFVFQSTCLILGLKAGLRR